MTEIKSPLAVTDPKIRKMLQLAGLRFVCSRARWLDSEAQIIGLALQAGDITSDQADAKIDELGALDLVYPELMGAANDKFRTRSACNRTRPEAPFRLVFGPEDFREQGLACASNARPGGGQHILRRSRLR